MMRNFFNSVKELCFPAVCLVCGGPLAAPQREHLCSACLPSIQVNEPPFCLQCGVVFDSREGESHLCSSCLQDPPYFDKARSVLRYTDEAAALIKNFKYRGNDAGRATFTELARRSGALQDIGTPDLIIPVPMHLKRLRQRGYNQAQKLACFFYAAQKSAISPTLLARQRETEAQAGLRGRERRRNLKGAFAVPQPDRIRGKRIVIVDDVFTTGTTVNECARTLKKHGAQEVLVLTLARVAGYF